jgi:uncharacterized membrane-anchored protein YitT (DUF2179 family)
MALGPFPGWGVLMAGLVYNGVLFLIGFATAGLKQATGEVLPKSGHIPVLTSLWQSMEVKEGATKTGGMKLRGRKRQHLICLIISSKPQTIADRIMRDLKRGVTALHGMGMHAQQEREVLLVATTVSEMSGIKAAVKAEDPKAFVIVTPAQEILGLGFQPLEI